MSAYHPRMLAILLVPAAHATQATAKYAAGKDTIRIEFVPHTAHLSRNNHNNADTLTISADWKDLGVDPRLIKHATVHFWIENVPIGKTFDAAYVEHRDPRFVGVAVSVSRRAAADGMIIDMEFQDYTCLFLRMKPYPYEGVPSYDATLIDAWRKICDNTGMYDPDAIGANGKRGAIVSSVAVLRDPDPATGKGGLQKRISGSTMDLNRKLSELVPARLKALGKWHGAHHDKSASAWDVWQHIAQSLGCITYIDGDVCVIEDTREYYARTNAPVFIYGKNIADCTENAPTVIHDSGICLVSMNPLTGTMMESVYPPPNDPRIYKSRAVANKKGYDPHAVLPVSDQYLIYQSWDVVNQDMLDLKARAAYEEYSRQELEGTIRTYELEVPTSGGDNRSLLDLAAGDVVRVQVDTYQLDRLSEIQGEAERVEYLIARGYSEGAASIIARGADLLTDSGIEFNVKQVEFSFDHDSFQIEISYHNRINTESNIAENPDRFNLK